MPPVVLGNLNVVASQQARLSYIALSNLSTSSLPRPRPRQSSLSASTKAAYSSFNRNDFQGPFTGIYEAPGPTRGPLGQASSHGAPRITPRRLKEYLDRYVIGQERAKKMLSVAVYSHYQRVQELQRQEEEEHERLSREAMIRSIRDDQDDRTTRENQDNPFISGQRVIKFAPDPGEESGPKTTRKYTPIREDPPHRDPLADFSPTTIEKSNVMVLGPTGVGKTHIVRTLARALEVPFSMSDCTPFTQAGYIGEDAELCVQRLLAAADYDVTRAEYGIICLDEVDKLAVSRSTNGRDVGGEGVQQALLKIIEGTTLTITAKHDQKSRTNTSNAAPFGSGFNTNNPSQTGNSGQKPETYTIRTDNILFIFTGAFVGLQKMIMDRLSKGSMGFGASVRSNPTSPHQMTMSNVDAHIYFKNLPFYSDIPSPTTAPPPTKALGEEESTYNPLDLATPQDLQTFGLIPEFLGRIPVTTALAPLSIASLTRVLTEPRNSIISQYVVLFSTFGAELRFTSAALHEIAKTAFELGTGARGVRTAVEMLLGEAMYEVPGSSVRYVLVDARAARREARVGYWSRGRGGEFRRAWEAEEKEWGEEQGRGRREGETEGSFEEFRERAGSGM